MENASRCKENRQIGQTQAKKYFGKTEKANHQKERENSGNKCGKEIGKIEVIQSCFSQGKINSYILFIYREIDDII